VFSFGQPRQVRIELDIELIDGNDRSENHWAEIARIIDGNRYHQRLDPACSECNWHQVLILIRRCHEQASLAGCHLITNVRIEDGEGVAWEPQNGINLAERAAAVATTM